MLAIVDAASGDIVREIKFEAFGEIFQPTWAPDGNSIAFSAQTGGFTDLFVYDLNVSQTKRLTNDAFADLQPAWSPDGTRLAFVTDRFAGDLGVLGFGNYSMAFITVADSAIAPIETGLNGPAINPQWSGDGSRLYFVGESNGRRNLWRLDLKTKETTQLTNELTGVAGITPLSPAISVAAGSIARGGQRVPRLGLRDSGARSVRCGSAGPDDRRSRTRACCRRACGRRTRSPTC